MISQMASSSTKSWPKCLWAVDRLHLHQLTPPCSDSSFFGDALSDVHRIVDKDTKIRLHNLGVLLENLTAYFQVRCSGLASPL